MGETLPAIDMPPVEVAPFPLPSANGGYAPRHRMAEGLVLEPVEWHEDHAPPEQSSPEAPTPKNPETLQSSPPEKIYSSAEGWTVSGRNNEKGELILRRENPESPTGFDVVRVPADQFKETPPEQSPAEARLVDAPQPEATPAPAEPESTTEQQENQEQILTDQKGEQWRYLGQSPDTGMHKIENLTQNHVKFITEEGLAQLTDIKPETEPPAVAAEVEQPATDPEKERMRQEIQQLNERVTKLEASIQKKESPYDLKIGSLAPVYSWAKNDYESARIIEENNVNGESVYKVMTAEGQTKTFFKDEVEYWFSHRSEPETAPKNLDEAKKRFSQKFQSIRQELVSLGGRVKSAATEAVTPYLQTAKEALEPVVDDAKIRAGYVAESAKGVLSEGLLVGQVVGEKIGAAAKEAAVNTALTAQVLAEKSQAAAHEGLTTGILTGQVVAEKAGQAATGGAERVAGAAKEVAVATALTGQVAGEKLDEKAEQYRRRLIGRAAGYAAVFSVWMFGPSEVPAASEPQADNNQEKVEAPPVIL